MTQEFPKPITDMTVGMPIFAGEDEQEQLGCIMEVLGVPSRYIIEQCSRRRLFFGKSMTFFFYISFVLILL